MADRLTLQLDRLHLEVRTSFLYDYEIKPCTDCRSCKRNNRVCLLDDGMAELYGRLEGADLFIIGTPVYWFGPTAKTKLFLDRFRPYFVSKKLEGKKAALLVPAGVGSSDTDLTVEIFKRSFRALDIEFIGHVPAEGYDIGDVERDPRAMEDIVKLAGIINDSLR